MLSVSVAEQELPRHRIYGNVGLCPRTFPSRPLPRALARPLPSLTVPTRAPRYLMLVKRSAMALAARLSWRLVMRWTLGL